MTVDEMNRMRRELNLTYQDICFESGIPISTVQKIFGGVTGHPRADTMYRLEAAFERLQKARSTQELHAVRESSPVYGIPHTEGKQIYTASERDALPQERRTELIDGVLYDMSSPTLKHQRICKLLCRQLDDCITLHPCPCEAFISPVDVALDRDEFTLVQPDVFVVCSPDMIREKSIQGAPDFIAEVLSPSTAAKDKSMKLWKYMRAGVREYWIVDPDKEKVVVYCLEETSGPFPDWDVTTYGFHDQIPITISKGACSIDMDRISRSL